MNPDRVKAMMEGAIIFGMSLALHGAITLKNGAVEQTNFHVYRLTRMPEAPRAIHVELIESEAPLGGAGESRECRRSRRRSRTRSSRSRAFVCATCRSETLERAHDARFTPNARPPSTDTGRAGRVMA